MALYRYAPGHSGQIAYAYRGGPLLAAGVMVELTEAQRDRLCGIVDGINGAPSLVPVDAEPTTALDEAPKRVRRKG